MGHGAAKRTCPQSFQNSPLYLGEFLCSGRLLRSDFWTPDAFAERALWSAACSEHLEGWPNHRFYGHCQTTEPIVPAPPPRRKKPPQLPAALPVRSLTPPPSPPAHRSPRCSAATPSAAQD